MDEKELDLIDSIEKKKSDIWYILEEYAEKYSLLINNYHHEYSKIRFNANISTFTKEEKEYTKKCFHHLLDEMVNITRKKTKLQRFNTTGISERIAYNGAEEFISDGLINGIKNNENVKKMQSIFGDYYLSVDVYRYLHGKNSIGQSQRIKLIKKGIITKLNGYKRCKLCIHEDKLREFIKIRLNHYKKQVR